VPDLTAAHDEDFAFECPWRTFIAGGMGRIVVDAVKRPYSVGHDIKWRGAIRRGLRWMDASSLDTRLGLRACS
jgi:hypothetical protein